MMALGETGGGVSACLSLLWLSTHSQAQGHPLVLSLAASSSFDAGDLGSEINYYPEEADAEVPYSWSYFSSGPRGMVLGHSLLTRRVGCCSWPGAAHRTCASYTARTLPGISPVHISPWGYQGMATRTGSGMAKKGFVSQTCIYAVKLCPFLV